LTVGKPALHEHNDLWRREERQTGDDHSPFFSFDDLTKKGIKQTETVYLGKDQQKASRDYALSKMKA